MDGTTALALTFTLAFTVVCVCIASIAPTSETCKQFMGCACCVWCLSATLVWNLWVVPSQRVSDNNSGSSEGGHDNHQDNNSSNNNKASRGAMDDMLMIGAACGLMAGFCLFFVAGRNKKVAAILARVGLPNINAALQERHDAEAARRVSGHPRRVAVRPPC